MNRQQLRQAVKTQQLFTLDQIREILHKDRSATLHKLADDYSAVMMWTLRNKYDFGHERSKKFIRHITETFDDIHAGLISIEDIKQTLNEEIGIVIK